MNVHLRAVALLVVLAGAVLTAWIYGLASPLLAAPSRQSDPIIVATPAAARFSRVPTPTPAAPPPSPAGTYRVRAGDTLLTVAVELGLDLADAHCLISPDYTPDQPLVIDDLLPLLPDDQRCHQVAPGETLAGVAAQYATTPAALRAIPWNELTTDLGDIVVLPPGRLLRVPSLPPFVNEDATAAAVDPLLPVILRQPVGTSVSELESLGAALVSLGALPVGGPARRTSDANAFAPVPANWPYGSGLFAWPLYGWLSQHYHGTHRAIDVAAPGGTLVTAADRGRVLRAGWSNSGYGNLVIIDHNIDYVTVYAHLSEVLVKEGEIVGQGDTIGRVGSTGNSTGPHLHFEIRDFGRRVDPIDLLAR
jgi:murein DD-endopeptidase MepM/ murein hydrolase activator NlpD